jgi:hypothetical protein
VPAAGEVEPPGCGRRDGERVQQAAAYARPVPKQLGQVASLSPSHVGQSIASKCAVRGLRTIFEPVAPQALHPDCPDPLHRGHFGGSATGDHDPTACAPAG